MGASARIVREMFGCAQGAQTCIIFMDEIDAIGGRRLSEGTSTDREMQRTLMKVRIDSSVPFSIRSWSSYLFFNQMDRFDTLVR